MSPKINKKVNVLTPAAEEPITDYEVVMGKIEHDAYKGYKGIEHIENNKDEVKP